MHPRKYFILNFLSMKYFLSKNFQTTVYIQYKGPIFLTYTVHAVQLTSPQNFIANYLHMIKIYPWNILLKVAKFDKPQNFISSTDLKNKSPYNTISHRATWPHNCIIIQLIISLIKLYLHVHACIIRYWQI